MPKDKVNFRNSKSTSKSQSPQLKIQVNPAKEILLYNISISIYFFFINFGYFFIGIFCVCLRNYEQGLQRGRSARRAIGSGT